MARISTNHYDLPDRQHSLEVFSQAPAAIAVMFGKNHVFEYANQQYLELAGKKAVVGKTVRAAFPELKDQGIYELMDTVYKTGKTFVANEMPVELNKQKEGLVTVYINFVYQPYKNVEGKTLGIMVHAVDVTQQVVAHQKSIELTDKLRLEGDNLRTEIARRKHTELVLQGQREILELITSQTSLSEILDRLVKIIEKLSGDELFGCILLLDADGTHLRHGAAPNLPKAFNKALDGIAIGPKVGSCGTAAFYKKQIIVSDIATNPLWTDFKELAARHHLKACWSMPILDSSKQLIGTFALYSKRPLKPSDENLELITTGSRTAAIAIETKQSHDKMKQSEERLRFMAESMPQKVFTANPNGDIDYFNSTWMEYTGLSFEQIRDWGWTQFIHPEDVEENVSRWQHSIDTGQPFILEHRFKRHDGKYHWHLSRAQALRDKKGQIVMWIGSNTDIENLRRTSDINKRMELLTKQRNTLIKLNKAKSDFTAVASHQLRTPATAVKQYISLLIAGYGGDVSADQLQYLQIAYDSNERQLTIVNDLLKTAQLDADNFKLSTSSENIVQLVAEVISELKPILKLRNQSITLDADTTTVSACVDLSEMKLVFTNLIENASKYTHPDKAITVKVAQKNHKVQISITDTGVGISSENLKRIFEKFTRIDNELSDTVNGTGLGLYWVKRIIKLHKGSLSVKSTLNEGSTFMISLPQ